MELDLAALMKGKSKKKAPPPADDYDVEPEEDEEGDDLDGPALMEQLAGQLRGKDFEGAWETLTEAVALAAEED